jgi:catalase
MLKGLGAKCALVAPTSQFSFSDGKAKHCHYLLEAAPSALFDAVVVMINDQQLKGSIEKCILFKEWVTSAFAHCKFIAYTPEAKKVLLQSGLSEPFDTGIIQIEDGTLSNFADKLPLIRYWDRVLAGACEG